MESLQQAKQREIACKEAQKLLQQAAEAVQRQAHAKIAGVVSKCLEIIFEDDAYKFQILFEQKRGRTEARLVFARDNEEINPLDSAGGGCVDVASWALRLACLILSKPQKRLLIIADEPFRFLSSGYVPRVRVMLETLSKELGVQFIIVTHQKGLRAGKVIEIGE